MYQGIPGLKYPLQGLRYDTIREISDLYYHTTGLDWKHCWETR